MIAFAFEVHVTAYSLTGSTLDEVRLGIETDILGPGLKLAQMNLDPFTVEEESRTSGGKVVRRTWGSVARCVAEVVESDPRA